MWYAGGGSQGDLYIVDIGYASSPDGTNWTKYDGNPVLQRGGAGQDTRSIWSPSVIDSAGVIFKMWYRGDNLEDSSAEQDYSYAESLVPAWKEMSPISLARSGLKSTVIDSMIYIFGGRDHTNATLSSCQAYNTSTNEWSDLAPMPKDLFGFTADAMDGKIYVTGGYSNVDGSWIASNSTMEYDPEGDIWQSKTDSPVSKAGMSSCVLNDTIYMFGGNPRDAIKATYYVPATDSWGNLPDMIYERPAASSAEIIDNKIYVIGGTYESGLDNPTGKSEVYDPELKVWTELEDMPVSATNHASVVHDQKILVFGGDSLFNLSNLIVQGTNIIQEYDPSTGLWSLLPGMPFKRGGMAGEKVGNYVYLVGGYENTWGLDPVAEVWRFDPGSPNTYISVTGISLDKDSLELHDSETETLVATITPEFATNPSVLWSSADQGIATVSEEGLVTGVAVGQTYIFVTAIDGNFKDSLHVWVTTGAGIDKRMAERVLIYPNPANDLLTIATGQPGQCSIEITSLNGQLIFSKEMEGAVHRIDLSSFPKGVYFITIRSLDFVSTRKIVKL